MEDGRRFDAGRRCLALLDARPDRPEALARWLVDCGLVPEGTPLDGVDDGWVERFAALRDAIDALVRAELTAATGRSAPETTAAPTEAATGRTAPTEARARTGRTAPTQAATGRTAPTEARAQARPALPAQAAPEPPASPAPPVSTAPPPAPAPPVSTAPPPAPALDRVNALAAAAAPPAPRAVPGPGGRLVRVLDTPPSCAALLAALARDAVDLLTDPAARARLRECEGDHCHRVYLDTSRGARRRWCSSATCGNRDRVARHRARTGRSAAAGGKSSGPC